MPTDYDGDPTATQTPASAPGPSLGPTVRLPADGDPVNADSLAQALKVLADYATWMVSPTAASGNLTEPIRRYSNARGQIMALIDHLGFPGGQLTSHEEDWIGITPVSHDASLDHARWLYAKQGTGGVITRVNEGEANGIKLEPDDVEGNLARMFERAAIGAGDAGKVLMFETEMFLLSTDDTEAFVGLLDESQGIAAVSSVTDAGYPGVGFIKREGDTNWFALFNAGAGGNTFFDTGFPDDGENHRMRIEIVGEDVADDSVSQVRYYIDGTLVYTHTDDFEAMERRLRRTYSIVRTTADTSTARLVALPNRYFVNLLTP